MRIIKDNILIIHMNYLLLISTLLIGAVIMATEILSTRFLSPLFGGDIYLWTSSISITLLALSIGYFRGGKTADSSTDKIETILYKQMTISALLLLITPKLTHVYLDIFQNVDMEYSVFLAMSILIGTPLYFLGKCSPIIIKIVLQDLNKLGSHASVIYIISTVGSLIGSILSGFVLLKYFDVKELIYATAFTIIITPLIYFVRTKQYKFLASLLFFAFLYPQPVISKDFEHSKMTFLYQKDTFYGSVKVVDIETKATKQTARYMILDGMVQGGIDNETHTSNALYSHYIETLMNTHNLDISKKQTALFIGLGPGVLPTTLSKSYNTTAIEINPVIIQAAQKYFDFNTPVHATDARKYLKSSNETYDNIVVDAYAGDSVPEHLATREFLLLLKTRLNSSGHVFFNMIGNPYTGLGSNALLSTIKSVFKTVDVYPLGDKNKQMMNFIVHAYDTSTPTEQPTFFHNIQTKIDGNTSLTKQMTVASSQFFEYHTQKTNILTDNSNKIMFLAQQEKSNARKQLYPFILETMF